MRKAINIDVENDALDVIKQHCKKNGLVMGRYIGLLLERDADEIEFSSRFAAPDQAENLRKKMNGE